MIKKLREKIYRALRRSEKYTKTDMVYLAKGGFWLTLGNVVSALGGFLLSITFANLLPKEIFGEYKYLLSITALLSITTLQGMSTAITKAIAQGQEGTFFLALKEKTKWGTLGALISLIIAGYYYFYNNQPPIAISFLIVALFMPFMDTFSLFNNYLNGKKNFKNLAIYNIIIQIVAVGTMITTLFLTNKLYLIIAAYFISNTLMRLIFIIAIIRKIPPEAKEDPEIIKYGKHLSFLNILTTIVKQIDQIIIFNFIGTAALATYSIAIAPIKEIQALIKNLDPLSLPKLAQKDFFDIQKTLPKKMIKLFFLILLGVTIYIIFIPYFFKAFYPLYSDSILYSRYLSLNLLFYPFILFNTAFVAHAKQEEIYVSTISSSIFYLITLFLLTYFYGLRGVVATVLLNSLFGTVINFILFKKNKQRS